MRRRTRRRVLAAWTTLPLMLGVYLAAAPPVAACDCMGLEPMAAYVGVPQRVIFSGTVQALEPRGVPVLVTRWFQGPDAAGIVMLKGAWGLGGASCETALPPAGTEWIFVAWRNEAGELEVNLCTPHAALGTDAGDAMLADAVATFGGGGGGGGVAADRPATLASGRRPRRSRLRLRMPARPPKKPLPTGSRRACSPRAAWRSRACWPGCSSSGRSGAPTPARSRPSGPMQQWARRCACP